MMTLQFAPESSSGLFELREQVADTCRLLLSADLHPALVGAVAVRSAAFDGFGAPAAPGTFRKGLCSLSFGLVEDSFGRRDI
jgi:hypothetical protein